MNSAYVSWDKEFHDFIVNTICKLGTWRMQLTISELTKEMQKLDPKHNVNLYRKQYGNTEGCLKQIKNPSWVLDSMVLKLKKYDDVKAVYEKGGISKECFENYSKAWHESQEKQKEIMKVNGQNKCKVRY